MALKITVAQPEHLFWVRLLYQQLSQEERREGNNYPEAPTEGDLDNLVRLVATTWSQPQDIFRVFLASVGKKVVGFLAIEIASRAVGAPHYYGIAHWLYVVPKHRKRGVARSLMRAGAEWLRGQGITVAEMSAVRHADRWKALGFKPYLVRYHARIDDLIAILEGNGHSRVSSSKRTTHERAIRR